MTSAAQVLEILADLSPSAQQRAAGLVIPLEWFRWLDANAVSLFGSIAPSQTVVTGSDPTDFYGVSLGRDFARRLIAIDQLRPQARTLRAGWLFVAGQREVEPGRRQRVFQPLVTVPVRVTKPGMLAEAAVLPAGDAAVTDLITDPEARRDLEGGVELGGGAFDGVGAMTISDSVLQRMPRLRDFALTAARAAGFEVARVVAPTESPDAFLRRQGLVVVVGAGIYTAEDVGGLSTPDVLRAWAGSATRPSAFHAVYGLVEPADPREIQSGTAELLVPFRLTPAQQEAVHRSRADPVSVISGAAGTGKSHAVAAIACDAMARGESVLIATKSDAAVDAVLDRLASAPGPEPVVFGSNERRLALARRLAAGELKASNASQIRSKYEELASARRTVARLRRRLVDLLTAESDVDFDPAEEAAARATAPGLFDPGVAIDDVAALVERARRRGGWFWSRRRARRAGNHLRTRAGAGRETSVDEIDDLLAVARRVRAARALVAAGGLDAANDWAALARAERQLVQAVGGWLAVEVRDPGRVNASRKGVAVLATALRSGRGARREQLRSLDDRLLRGLPLWVGTLADIEDLLPARPGLFDLVILDEASAIDQPLAAPALLRGARAVVVGDPHQLRHVSFLSDTEHRAAVERHQIGDPILAARLDVRRNSLFDVAVGVAAATHLDEHFRCAPHLVDFVARRLYSGRLFVATRSPATQSRDAIEVVRVAGTRDARNVVVEEVDAVLGRLRTLRQQGATSVGVVSPFRAQADAIETAVLEHLPLEDIEALDLRIGTVHAFQGNERDVVIVSVGAGDGAPPATWRFASDPNLFAVLATRARDRLVLLLSGDPPARSLLAEYLAEADAPPRPPVPTPISPWGARVAEALAAAGVECSTGYPAGRHVVDVVAGDPRRFVGIECGVHPDGPQAHIDRHLALRGLGWELVEAHRSRWEDRRGELVIDLANRLGRFT